MAGISSRPLRLQMKQSTSMTRAQTSNIAVALFTVPCYGKSLSKELMKRVGNTMSSEPLSAICGMGPTSSCTMIPKKYGLDTPVTIVPSTATMEIQVTVQITST